MSLFGEKPRENSLFANAKSIFFLKENSEKVAKETVIPIAFFYF